jgi:gliding motility-associated-like protein
MLVSFSATSQVSVTADFTTNTSTTGCGSLVVEFEDLSTGNPTSWQWDFGNGNTSLVEHPTAIYVNPGVYNVQLKVDNGITNDIKIITSLVKVHEEPDVDLKAISDVFGCMPLLVDFADISIVSTPIVNWQWDFGDGSSSNLQIPSYTYTTDGEFSVSLSIIDANGCQGLATEIDLVEVNKVPKAIFEVDNTFSCNATETINFTNNSISASSFLWDFGDGATSILSNPSYNYNSGIYTVTLYAKEGSCVDTLIMDDMITIGGLLSPDFSVNTNSICEGESVNFNDITANNPNIFLWDFGDGTTSTLQNPTHVYNSSGLFDVTLTTSISGQCATSYTFPNEIEVSTKPNIDFSVDTSYSCSVPFNVVFTDNTANAVGWNWDFGNGQTATGNNPINSFMNFGLFDVTLEVEGNNGCTNSFTQLDLIEIDKIVIGISATEVEGCSPMSLSFTDVSTSSRPLVDWDWNFGDGNFANFQNPSHVYTSSGLFDVSLLVKNEYGCSSSFTLPNYIQVDEAPTVNFDATPKVSCAGENIDFSDLSSLGTNNWEWSFGDNSTSNTQNPTYQYSQIGLYDISLIAGVNSCKDTLVFYDFIEIIKPSALFDEDYNCDNPLKVEFINLSVGADNVLWDFGDGTTSILMNPTHVFTTLGVHSISLSVTNNITGCVHEYIKQIKLTQPIANFDYLINSANNYDDSVGCVPKRVHIVNQSQDWSHYKVLWSDGYVGYGRQDHIFTTPGYFDVTLIITDIHGCKDTLVRNNMYHMYDVEVEFGISDVLGCDSMLVDFVDLTAPISVVNWMFGDGGTSNLNNPQHIYYNAGFYDVTVFAESAMGCKDTLTKVEYIKFQYPTADLSSNIQEICPGNEVQFTNLSDGIGIISEWDFGDGSQSNSINPIHEYLSNGIYDVNLFITDSFGCSDVVNLNNHIEVLAPISSFTTLALSSNCPPFIADFTNYSSSDAVSFSWLFGDGESSIVENPSHLYAASGLFDVSLIVENSFGCKDTVVQNGLINISVGPSGTFSMSDSVICKDDFVSFVPEVVNTNTFLWDFGDGVLSTDSFPTYGYSNGGEFIPVLIIEDSLGCKYTVSNNDTLVVREVIVDAGLDVEICEGAQIQLNAVGNAALYNWVGGVLINNSISNPVVNPVLDMIYTVVNSDGLCSATDSLLVTVHNDVPNVNFITNNHCAGDTVEFIGTSGLLTTNNNYIWSFGQNGQFVNEILPIGISSISLIVQNLDNSCSDTLVKDVEIYQLPTADFVSNEVCLGEQMLFLDNSSANTVNWAYSFADGIGVSVNQNPTYFYTNPGVYNVSLNIVSNDGCENSIIKDVIVYELPLAGFVATKQCEGIGNIFTNNSSVVNGNISSIQYDFLDGAFSSDSIVTHVFNGNGLFDVMLTVTSNNGCKSSIIKSTEVYASPVIDFEVSGFCESNPTIFNNFSTVANSNIVSYNWIFDIEGSSIDRNPMFTFSNNGVYDITLTAISDNGCEDFGREKITIFKEPVPNFEVTSDVCLGDEVLFTDLSVGDGLNILSWNYNFGDGSSSGEQNPAHSFNYVGQFNISLEVTTELGCVNDTIIHALVEVHKVPTANFQASTLLASELDPEIDFYNNSEDAITYQWSFGNGDLSFDENPVYTFNNTQDYDVTLIAISASGCSDEITKVVHIHPEYTIFIPNAFTPDGDGINDIFEAKGNGISGFEMQVFDRWGGVVFESSNLELGWDGTNFSGDPTDNGIYMYHVALYDYNGRLWVYNGELNLMR